MTDVRKKVAEQLGALMLANIELMAQLEAVEKAKRDAEAEKEKPATDSAQ